MRGISFLIHFYEIPISKQSSPSSEHCHFIALKVVVYLIPTDTKLHDNAIIYENKINMKLVHLFLLKFSDKVSACLEELKTSLYSGMVSVTNQGQPCQAWLSQTPHHHTDNKDGKFPLDGSVKKARNYCRALSGSGKPGCYTTDPLIVWGFCHLRICNGKRV